MQRGSASPSAAELSNDESSDSGSHAGHLVRAIPRQPTHASDSETIVAREDEHGNSDSLSSDSAAGAREVYQNRRQAQLASPQGKQEASISSSGWSSPSSSLGDDDDTANEDSRAGGTRHMAESMLAALATLHHRSAATRSAAAAAHHTVHEHTLALSQGDVRQHSPHVSMPAPRLAAGGQKGDQHGEESAQVPESDNGSKELHWEPAVQLPSLQAADAGRSLELLRNAEPVLSGQVRLQFLHTFAITCCTLPGAPLHHTCQQVCTALRSHRSLLGEGSCRTRHSGLMCCCS